jgi:peptide/nickel transport system ATP-binding protein
LVEARGIRIWFPITRGLFQRVTGHLRAVDGVDLAVSAGSVHALVGESGCGKTTLGNALLGLTPLTAGSVSFKGSPLAVHDAGAMRPLRRLIQPVFQDPFSSLNPRLRVGDLVEESMLAHTAAFTSAERKARAAAVLERVGLEAGARMRYPHEFSGGQRQRICIARALAVGPEFMVCDEPTSALDVSVQAQILNLLGQLRAEMGLTYLLITHDLGVVEYCADEVSVMYLGRIVEKGPLDRVFGRPAHPYTRALLAAVPRVVPGSGGPAVPLKGDVPSPVDPPSGCPFHPRCPSSLAICPRIAPREASLSPGHCVSCHLYGPKD